MRQAGSFWSVILFPLLLFPSTPLPQSALTLSSVTAAPGGIVALDLSLSSAASSLPAAIQWTFTYPSSAVANFNVTAGAALTSANKTVTCAGGATAYVCMASGMNANTIPNGVIATVLVTLSGSSAAAIVVASGLGVSSSGNAIPVTTTGGTVNVTSPITIGSLGCNPSTLAPSGSSLCTVAVSSSTGTTVSLGSSSANLVVPASVEISAGAASTTFNATAKAFTADQTATITASLNGSSKSASISLVAPLAISSLQCAAASLASNGNTTCTVTLSKPPSSDTLVALANNASPALTVPASVTVLANATSATFAVSTGALTADQTATITASLNVSSKPASISLVAPLVISSLQCAAASLASNANTTCTVTLSQPPSVNTAVSLANIASPALTVPASATVLANATSATFTVSTGALTADRTATITASLNGSSKPASISLVAPLVISSLQCAAASLASNANTTCTVTLSKPPSVNTAVSLANSASPALTVPASATVLANATSATFTVSTGALTADRTATITASLNGSSKPASISLVAPLASMTTGTATFVKADNAASGTWKGVYGADGYNVIGNAASVPSFVTMTPSGNLSYVWASSTTDTRGLQTASAPSSRIAACWYTWDSMYIDLAFNDTNPHQVAIYLVDWDYLGRSEKVDILDANNTLLDTRSVASFAGGQYLVWNLRGHVILRITNTNPSSSAVISGLFFGTSASARSKAATTGGTTIALANSPLTVLPPVTLESLTCSPSTLIPGVSGTCMLALTGAATSTVKVTLWPGNKRFTISPSVTIPAGSANSVVPFTTSANLSGSVVLTASYGSVTESFSFLPRAAPRPLKRADVVSLSCPKRIIEGTTGVCDLEIAAPGSSDVAKLSIASSSLHLRVPDTIRLRARQTTVRFAIVADSEAIQEDAVLEARSGDNALKETLTIASSGRRLSAPKELSAKPGDRMRFQVAASRSDAISAFGLPPGSRFDAATAAFEWTPTSADLGRHEITFLAAAVPGTPEVHTVVVNIGSGLPVLTGLRNLAGAALCSPTTIAGITGRFLAEGGDTRVRVNGEYATVLAASGDRTDFLCPDLPAGSPLDIAVETPADRKSTRLNSS